MIRFLIALILLPFAGLSVIVCLSFILRVLQHLHGVGP
jgi:hypothetical protein